MKVSFDPRAHAATFILRDDPVVETVEAGDGFLVDVDELGRIVAVEITDIRNPGDLHALAERFDIQPLLRALHSYVEGRWSSSEEVEISQKVLAGSR